MRATSTIHRLLLAAGLLCVATVPLRAEEMPAPFGAMTPVGQPAPLAAPQGDAPEATGIEWLDQESAASLHAANSFSNSYLTPPGFSKVHDNDALPTRLHLHRNDPDLAVTGPYGTPSYQLSPSEEMDPALLGLAALGVATAAVSGVLLYARNPISRKRKYRRTAEERSRQRAA